MTAPRLSVCIATLNRASFLSEMLESIVSQATDDVEIVIVDGASTDDTPAVVQGFQKRFPALNYVRLPAKGGVDQDYDRAVQEARGEYCWLLSDDDRLKPGAIQAVLDATIQDPALIIVNAQVRNYDLSRIVIDRMLAFETDRTYLASEQERLLVETASYLTFIGGVVIKREIWMQRERQKYYGTAFIHVGVIFGTPLNRMAIALAEPWILVRYSNASWGSRAFSIWAFRWPGLIWSFAGYRDESKRRVCVREPWRNKKGLLMYRAKGMYFLKEYQEWLAPRLTSRWDRLVARGIASFPGVPANLIVWVYFSLFKPRDRFAFADLQDSPFYYGKIFRRA